MFSMNLENTQKKNPISQKIDNAKYIIQKLKKSTFDGLGISWDQRIKLTSKILIGYNLEENGEENQKRHDSVW